MFFVRINHSSTALLESARRRTIDLRITISTIWLFVLAVALASFSAVAQETPPLKAEINPWGNFEPGAWKRIRVITENFNEQEAVASTIINDSKTTLYDLDGDSLTLETKSCVETAGKRRDSDPQMVKQGFHGEVLSPNLQVKESVAGQVEIDDKKISCQVLKLESTNGASKTATTIYYSATVVPHILKRESRTTDLEGKTTISETITSLVSLEMPYLIDGEIRVVAQQKTVQKSPKGMVITLAAFCPEIPGGIVSQSSKELDAAGRLVRRNVLELVGYGSEPEKDRSVLFGRKRSNRYRSR
jgi:hypothetical protein